MARSRGSRTSASRARPAASSRTETGGGVGACQTRPQARSSCATVTSARAASRVAVQLCGASRSAGTSAGLLTSTLGATVTVMTEYAPAPMKSEARTVVQAHPVGLVRGVGLPPDLGPDAALDAGGGQGQVLGHGAFDRPVGVEVVEHDVVGAGAFRRGEQPFGQRREGRGPGVVRRGGAVEQGGGTPGDLREPVGVGGVGGHALDRRVLGPPPPRVTRRTRWPASASRRAVATPVPPAPTTTARDMRFSRAPDGLGAGRGNPDARHGPVAEHLEIQTMPAADQAAVDPAPGRR